MASEFIAVQPSPDLDAGQRRKWSDNGLPDSMEPFASVMEARPSGKSKSPPCPSTEPTKDSRPPSKESPQCPSREPPSLGVYVGGGGQTAGQPPRSIGGVPEKRENSGDPWREYTFNSDPSQRPSAVPRLPEPQLTSAAALMAPGCVLVERQSLRGIGEMLIAQQALQQEFVLRFSSMVDRDQELLRGLTNWDKGFLAKMCRGDLVQHAQPRGDTMKASRGDQGGDIPEEPEVGQDMLPATLLLGPGGPRGSKKTNFGDDMEEAKAKVDELASPTNGFSDGCKKSKVFELAEGFQQEIAEEEEAKHHRIEPLWKKIVRSDRFDLAIGGVIVLNTFMMLLNLELTGGAIKKCLYGLGGLAADSCGEDMPRPAREFFVGMEHMFTAVFLLEMLLRVAADGYRFLFNPLHLLDVFIVIISVVDLWILVPLGAKGSSGMAVLRIARLAKLAKVFRVVRVLKAFEPLRILVTTISHSVSALAWSMTLLFVLEVIGSIFLAQLLQSYITDDSNEIELRKMVWERFGTWSRAMYTAYEITMSPGGFLQYRTVIENVSPMVGGFFVVYGCTVTFAVIRVITALFLRATLSVCDREELMQAQTTLLQRNAFAERLQASIDEDGSGGIDFGEFTTLIDLPQMKEWLQDAGLTEDLAKRLFRGLMNDSGEMNFMQFLQSLSQMRGPPRSSDLMVVSFECRKVLHHTSELIRLMHENLGDGLASRVENKIEEEVYAECDH